MSRFWRQGAPSAALALVVMLGGCGGDRRGARNAGETGSADSMAAADTGSMDGAGSALTDANIVALLDGANQADSASGALAVAKGTSAEVKAFGKLMMKDHHKLRAEGAQLALKEKINPAPLPNDPVAAMALHEQHALQSTPKGAEFDRTYIQHEIAAHRAVLDLLDRSESATTNPKLKALIEKARPEVQEHLTKAEAILKKLPQGA